MKPIMFTLSFIALLFSSFSLSAQSNYKIANKIHVDGEGGWDYLNVDEVNGRLFVSHATVAQAIDIKTGKLVGTIPDTKGIHGIAIAADLNKGFTSNGRDSSVTVFNLKTLEVIAKIQVPAKNPDAILYDPFSHKLFTFNGRSSNSTVIDASSNKVIANISFEGKPEFAVTNGKGKIFVNIETKNSISEINTSTLKVVKTWSIAPGESPSGLAFDVVHSRLFSVCDNKLMVISDAAAGKVITTVPIGDGPDGAAFDPGLKRAYCSNGDGTMTVVQEVSPNSFKVLENVSTQRGARTITIDKVTHHLYLPTAEYESVSTPNNRRPAMKPNSFTILDVQPLK